jgi:nucleoside-diphosphate-sugar epimerase
LLTGATGYVGSHLLPLLVTPVEAGLVRPLVDGLREEMVVRTPPPPGINDAPMGFEQAVREALAQR